MDTKQKNDIQRKQTIKEIETILSRLQTCKIIICQNKGQIEYEVRQKKHHKEEVDISLI